MATQPVLAGNTLPHPSSYDFRRGYRGGRRKMADGSVVVDLVNANARHEFTLTWQALTAANLSTIETAVAAIKDASGSFTSPRNTVHTVHLAPDSPDLEVTMYTTALGDRFNATLRLYED